MNRDLKIWGVIFGIVVIGAGVTSVTRSCVGGAYRSMQDEYGKAAAERMFSADAASQASSGSRSLPSGESAKPDYRTRLAEYPDRLAKLDAQIEIERMRGLQTDNTVQAVKEAVLAEQGIWERELDAVYRLLAESLDEPESSRLRASQQEWIEERDTKAREASGKNSGVSLESVEYSASVAASTRDRVYDLVEQYQ